MSKLSLSSSKIRTILLLVVILSIVVFAFLPSLKNGFVFWDDDTHLFQNVSVRTLDAEHVGSIFTSKVNEIYIPLTTLSFALEHHFFGRGPFVYHLNNLLLHLAIVALIFWFGTRLGLSVLGSGAAALLFGIHPLHVESVAWITERKDVLYSLFYMAALLSYCRYLIFTKSTPSIQNKKQIRFLVLTALFGILSMLAKPMALSLPLILLLLDWVHNRKITRGMFVEKIPLVCAIAGIALITYVTHARIPGKGAMEGVLIWSWTFTFYLRQFVFPLMLFPVYLLPNPITFSNPEYFLSVIVVCLVILTIIRFRKNRWFIFALAFYFFSIFFLLRYDETKDINIVADRFMYLPSLGFCFLLGYSIERVLEWNNRRIRILIVVTFIVVMAVFSIQTRQQCRIWYDTISLWSHQLKTYPNHHVALNNLAAALREKEEYKKAIEIYKRARKTYAEGLPINFSDDTIHNIQKVNYVIGLYGKAIASKPNFTDAHYSLGSYLRDIGRIPEAVLAYKEVLKRDHKYKGIHFSLGKVYQKIGDYNQAVYAYDQAMLLNPDDEDMYVTIISTYNEALQENSKNALYRAARGKLMDDFARLISQRPPRPTSFFNLGFLYGGMGDMSRAIAAYQMVLDINPNHSNTIYNLGNIYRDQGRLSEALEMYHRAIKANPRNSDVHLNVGSIYERQGKQEQARKSFQRAIKFNPENSRAYFNLGYSEEKSGKLLSAIDLYKKSITLDSSNKEVHYNLGNAYARLNKNSEAISSYLKAVEIDFKYMDALINLSTTSYKAGNFADAVKYCDEAIILGYKAPSGYLKALEPYRINKNY